MAAAIFGDGAKSEVVKVWEETKFKALANGKVDLLTTKKSIFMAQDIYEKDAREGIAYSIPYLRSGLTFTGPSELVECADNEIDIFDNCSQLVICINGESSFWEELQVRVPNNQLVVENNSIALFQAFKDGRCNVIASEAPAMTDIAMKAMGYTGDEVVIGKRQYTSEMWSLKSLDSDPEFANFINAALMALLAAEEAGITRETADRMGQTELFGERYRNMFVDVVRANGNFGELDNNPEYRSQRNQPNDGSTGLLVTPSLGLIEQQNFAPAPIKGGILERVLDRGVLNCGIRGDRPGFASFNSDVSGWEGMDIDYCSALAAALFNGTSENVVFLDVTTSRGWAELEQGAADVMAGAVWTLEDVVRGFSFSAPYFYGVPGSSFDDENLCLATLQIDPQWSSYVYWTAQSLVYAEEHGITQRQSNEMPLVQSFGPSFERMFRDAVLAVGNYGEVYERHLAGILPRGGRNTLNILEEQGPLRYLPPGFAILSARR